LTKAFAVLIPGAAIFTPLTADLPDRVRLYDLPQGAKGVQFTVMYAGPAVYSSSWPGARAMRSTLVGRFTLPISGETVYVLAQALEQLPTSEPKSMTGQLLHGATQEDLHRSADEGSLRAVALGSDEDGTWWFMDMRGRPASASLQE
jgi:hypothetical protein